MNIKAILRAARYVGAGAIISFVLAETASAATHWYIQPIGFFGSHYGVYQDIVAVDINQSSHVSLEKFVPITTYASYMPFHDNYRYWFGPADLVDESFDVGNHTSPFFFMYAVAGNVIFAGANVPTVSDFFLQTNSMLICPQETFFSPYLTSVGKPVIAEVDLAYCPEGGFPVQARGQYLHGMN